MTLSGVDLNLLHVFLAVVEANGVANAQGALGRDASTISRSLSQLEKRLGIHLCERGRRGFRLTPEGVEVHAQATQLFTAFHGFEKTLESLQGVSTGQLHLGIIDNIVSDPHCPLIPALQAFYRPERSGVDCHLEVLTPEQMERQLLNKSTDIGVSVFENHHSELRYHTLYQEKDRLYCAAGHPAAGLSDDQAIGDLLAASRHVSRRFLRDQEMRRLNLPSRDRIVFTANLEAVAALILSGQYLGFLPEHYARPWVDKGELVDISPHLFARFSPIEAAVHVDSERRPVVTALIEQLLRVHGNPCT